MRGELLEQAADVEKKFVLLLGAFPDDKLKWRPAPGVRSVSEVAMHVASDNVLLPAKGLTPPPIKQDSEKTVTQKKQVLDLTRSSFQYFTKALENSTDADMNQQVDFFGTKLTRRAAAIGLITHMSEHLGQLIAYARMNGIVPPWSK